MLEGKLLPMLYVRDVPKSVEFYRDVLGFEFRGWWDDSRHAYVPDPPISAARDFAELGAGDLVLHLHQAQSDQVIPETAPAILHLLVRDADAYYREVRSRAGELEPPRDQPWGWRQFYIRDPDGHQWSFHHVI
jgi:uncharacterized glyoxalase superfamily protein PhnB